jgi:hypothetical protein
MPRSLLLCLGFSAAVLFCPRAGVAGVMARYVKTLGQSNVQGQPFKTAGYRVSLDKEGNLYLCGEVTAPWSKLMKLAPDGRIVWEVACGGYERTVTAVEGDFVYVASKRDLLRRYSTAAGKLDAEWGYGNVAWGGPCPPPPEGFPKFVAPSAMLARGDSLFVVDRGADELLRLDKSTGKLRPFKTRLMAVEPVDLAPAKNGKLLLLTAESLFQIDADGNPGDAPLIDGLAGAVAVDVAPADGNVLVAVGGVNAVLANQIVVHAADGKPTGTTLGEGGGYSGMWKPDRFAFAGDGADFAADAAGGVWVSKMGALPMLTHFDKSGKQDALLMGAAGHGLAVTPDLGVVLGGSYLISWENRPIWTSGLVRFGDLERYPAMQHAHWRYSAAYADAATTVFFGFGNNTILSLSAKDGVAQGQSPNVQWTSGFCSAGKNILHLSKDGSVVSRPLGDLGKPTVFAKSPDGVKLGGPGLAVSADKDRLYATSGDKIVCLGKDGAKVWETAGRGPFALMRTVLWALPPSGPGVVAIDAQSGQPLGVFGDKEIERRPALAPVALAVAAKDGKDYLFVSGNWQVQVFEISGL